MPASVNPDCWFVAATVFTNLDDFQVSSLPTLTNNLCFYEIILRCKIIQVNHGLEMRIHNFQNYILIYLWIVMVDSEVELVLT